MGHTCRVPDREEAAMHKRDVFYRQEIETNLIDVLRTKEFIQYDLGINPGSHKFMTVIAIEHQINGQQSDLHVCIW